MDEDQIVALGMRDRFAGIIVEVDRVDGGQAVGQRAVRLEEKENCKLERQLVRAQAKKAANPLR